MFTRHLDMLLLCVFLDVFLLVFILCIAIVQVVLLPKAKVSVSSDYTCLHFLY